jgi:hypothetical protein
MGSLKLFLPAMAGTVGTTADALYSRQRALVDLGVLRATPGRGPGSGTPCNGESVSAMIIALMVADSLQDTDRRVVNFCHAQARDSETCPLTGARTFQGALAAILESAELTRSFSRLSISRNYANALIYYDRGLAVSVFQAKAPPRRSFIELRAELNQSTFAMLASLLAAEREGIYPRKVISKR